MKKIYSILPLLLTLTMVSCKKEEKIDFQFNKDLEYAPTELDNWLTSAFTDSYNIKVLYRYDRYKDGDLSQNLVPAKEEKVEEQMKMVLDGYLLPYETAGGKQFIKTFAPKEWILSGSYSIQSDGSRVLAISSGGRNITLYEVNDINSSNPDIVRPRLKTIHHEFAHTLDQIKRQPVEFEAITSPYYTQSWRNTTDAENDNLGFVSRYARSSFIEDFAETIGFLLTSGQLWYDNKAGKSSATGYTNFKKKEDVVVKYFRDSYGVDFRKLQREVAATMYEKFNDKTFQTFEYWFFNQGLFVRDLNTVTGNISADVKQALDKFKADMLAYHPTNKYVMQDMVFMFGSSGNSLILRIPYKIGANPVVYADYNFTFSQNPTTHKITFTKVAQGTGVNYTNAALFINSFMTNISSYLTGNTFNMDWSVGQPNLTRRDEGFLNTAGFYKESDPTSYINFQLTRVKK